MSELESDAFRRLLLDNKSETDPAAGMMEQHVAPQISNQLTTGDDNGWLAAVRKMLGRRNGGGSSSGGASFYGGIRG